MLRRGSLLRTLAVVSLVVLILMALHFLGWLRPIESGVTYVFEPVVRGVHSVGQRIGNAFSLIGGIANLDDENKSLAKQLAVSQAEVARLKDQQAELADLRERLNAPLDQEIKTEVAAVIGHDAITGTKRLIINRGSRDGLQENMAVLSSGGVLIGRINKVLAGQAEILLLTDDRSAIPSRIAESRATGITHGELGLGLKMTDIPQQDTVNPGDLVVSSGLGAEMPKGLVIGSVESIDSTANALFQVAHVRPLSEINQLEFVHVVTRF